MSTLPSFCLGRAQLRVQGQKQVPGLSCQVPRPPDLRIWVFSLAPLPPWKSGPGFSSYLTASGWGLLLLAPSQAKACLVPTRSWKKQSIVAFPSACVSPAPAAMGPGLGFSSEWRYPCTSLLSHISLRWVPCCSPLHCTPSSQSLSESSSQIQYIS